MTVTDTQYVNEMMTAVTDHDPYVYGGVSLIHGADCSGEFWGCNAALGLKNGPRTAQEMFEVWPVAPGPGYGIAVFFFVNQDGPASSQPQHMALCISTTTEEEEPHTGLDAEVVAIPNIPGVESIMGYRYVPGVTYGPTATTKPAAPTTTAAPTPQEDVYMIPSGCNDAGALRAQIREWWTTYRSDVMTVADSNLFALVFTEPVGNGGYGGNPDLLLAGIIDGATKAGTLRAQFAGSV